MKTTFLLLSTVMPAMQVQGHGAMVSPRPRSSHGQIWDDANKCGSANPYSTANNKGDYCGLGCLGDACLYYQIGCFQGCSTCSLQGKTLYPVQADLDLAGCAVPPAPTLGGGNTTLEHQLRTYNIDLESAHGDWTAWMPWRSPGSTGRGNPEFQPCGVNSGALASQPEPPTTAQDVPNGGPGTALPMLAKSEWAVWKAGSVVQAEWSIYANHGGGYSYRLCKKIEGQVETEECYQKTPLSFAAPETEIRYQDGSLEPFNITSPTTDVGTYPPGSQWRKNAVPMCGCDIGISCGGKAEGKIEETEENKTAMAAADKHFHQVMLGGQGKDCTANPTCENLSPKTSGCKVCANSTALPWSCSACCDGCIPTKYDGGMYCTCAAPDNDFTTPYKTTHFRPGQTSDLCPTGVQYPTLWDGGAGAGFLGTNPPPGGHGGSGFGNFAFTMVDFLQVPNVPAGDYSVSWRWDCEETPQVWNSCADIVITA